MNKFAYKIQLNQEQKAIFEKLTEISKKISEKSFLNKFWGRQAVFKNIYLHSKPGRGKSLLMKNFFENVQNSSKKYFHFNEFMRQIHLNLKIIRTEEKTYQDQFGEALRRISDDCKILCFDEFQINDIFDAMIFEKIFKNIVI